MFCEFLESVKLFPNHWSAKDTFRCVRWQRALELVHLFLQGTAWQVLFFSSGPVGTARTLEKRREH